MASSSTIKQLKMEATSNLSIASLPQSILLQGISKCLSPVEISSLGGTCRSLKRALPRKPLRIQLYSVGTETRLSYNLYVTEQETGRMVLDPSDNMDDPDGAFCKQLYTNTQYILWRFDFERNQWTYLRRDIPLKENDTELFAHDLAFRARRRRTSCDMLDSGHLVTLRFANDADNLEKQAIPTLSEMQFVVHIQGDRENWDKRWAHSSHPGILTVVRTGEEGGVSWRSVTMHAGNTFTASTAPADSEDNEVDSNSRLFRIIPFSGKSSTLQDDCEPVSLPIRPIPVCPDNFGRLNYYSARTLGTGENLKSVARGSVVEFVMWTQQNASGDDENTAGATPETFLCFMTVGQGRLPFILQIPFALTIPYGPTERKCFEIEPLLALCLNDDPFPVHVYFAMATDRIEGRGDYQPTFLDFYKNFITVTDNYTSTVLRSDGDTNDTGPSHQDPFVLPIIRVRPSETPRDESRIPSHDFPDIPLDMSRRYYVEFIVGY